MAFEGGVFIDVLTRLNMASVDRVLKDVKSIMKEAGTTSGDAFTTSFDSTVAAGAREAFDPLVAASDAAFRQMQIGMADLQAAEARINDLRARNYRSTTDQMIAAQAQFDAAVRNSQKLMADAASANAAYRDSFMAAPVLGERGAPSERTGSTGNNRSVATREGNAGASESRSAVDMAAGGAIAAGGEMLGQAEAGGKGGERTAELTTDVLGERFKDHLANGARGLVRAGGLASILGLTGMAASGVRSTSRIQQNLQQLRALQGESDQNMAIITPAVWQQAVETGINTNDISKLYPQVERATNPLTGGRLQGQDAITVVNNALRLSKVAGITPDEALQGLTTSLANYRTGPQGSMGMANLISQGLAGFKGSAQDYFEAQHSIEPIAEMTGIKAPEVFAALDIESQRGQSAQQSAQNTANLLKNLARPTSMMSSALQQIGLNPEDLSVQLSQNGIGNTIGDILQKITDKQFGPNGSVVLGAMANKPLLEQQQQMIADQLSPEAKQYMESDDFQKSLVSGFSARKILEKAGSQNLKTTDMPLLQTWLQDQQKLMGASDVLKRNQPMEENLYGAFSDAFGGKDAARAAVMLGGSPEALAAYKNQTTRLEGAQNDPNSFMQAFKTEMDTNVNQWHVLGQSLGKLSARIGDDLLPTIKTITEGMSGLADFLDKHKTAEQALIDAMLGLAGFYVGQKLTGGLLGKGLVKAGKWGVNKVRGIGGSDEVSAGSGAAEGEGAGTLQTAADTLEQAANTLETGAGTFETGSSQFAEAIPAWSESVGIFGEAVPVFSEAVTAFAAGATPFEAGAGTLETAASTMEGVASAMEAAASTLETAAAQLDGSASALDGAAGAIDAGGAGGGILGGARGGIAGLMGPASAAAAADMGTRQVPQGSPLRQILNGAQQYDPTLSPGFGDPNKMSNWDPRKGAAQIWKWLTTPTEHHWQGGITGQPLADVPDKGVDSVLGLLPNGEPVGLRGGEGILTPETVQALGGPEAVDSLNKNPWANPLKAGTQLYSSFAKGVAKYSPYGKYLVANSQSLSSLEKEHEQAQKIQQKQDNALADFMINFYQDAYAQQGLRYTGQNRDYTLGGYYTFSKNGNDRFHPDKQGDYSSGSGGRGGDPNTMHAIAQAAAEMGLDQTQYDDVKWIFSHESGFDPTISNGGGHGAPSNSKAYGLGQFLGHMGDKYGQMGAYSGQPGPETKAAIQYMIDTYGSPAGAKAYWQAHGNYSRGGVVGYAQGGVVTGQIPYYAPDPKEPGSDQQVPGLWPKNASPGIPGSPYHGRPKFPDWWKQALNDSNGQLPWWWMPGGSNPLGPGWEHDDPSHPLGFAGGGIIPLGPPTPTPSPPKDPTGGLLGGPVAASGPKAPPGPPQPNPNPNGTYGPFGTNNLPGMPGQPKKPRSDAGGHHKTRGSSAHGNVPSAFVIPGGTGPTGDRNIKDNPSQQLTAEGKGFGVGGGLIGMAESAASMGADAFAPGSGQAAQSLFQLANLGIGQLGKLVGIGWEGLMETFLPNDDPAADPSKNIFGKVALGLAGAHPSGKNMAGMSAKPLQPKKDLDAGAMQAKQMPGIHVGEIHNHSGDHKETFSAINKAVNFANHSGVFAGN